MTWGGVMALAGWHTQQKGGFFGIRTHHVLHRKGKSSSKKSSNCFMGHRIHSLPLVAVAGIYVFVHREKVISVVTSREKKKMLNFCEKGCKVGMPRCTNYQS